MAQPNSQTKRELAKLGADFASININNSHITHSKSKNASQAPDQQKEVYYYLHEFETTLMIKRQYLVQPYCQICIHQS